MNTQYLCEYVSKKLHTYVRQYSASYELIHQVCCRLDMHIFKENPFPSLPWKSDTHSHMEIPTIFVTPQAVSYSVIPVDTVFF